MGRPIIGRTRTCKNLSIDSKLYEQIVQLSKQLNRPISRLIDGAIELLLKEYIKDGDTN